MPVEVDVGKFLLEQVVLNLEFSEHPDSVLVPLLLVCPLLDGIWVLLTRNVAHLRDELFCLLLDLLDLGSLVKCLLERQGNLLLLLLGVLEQVVLVLQLLVGSLLQFGLGEGKAGVGGDQFLLLLLELLGHRLVFGGDHLGGSSGRHSGLVVGWEFPN